VRDKSRHRKTLTRLTSATVVQNGINVARIATIVVRADRRAVRDHSAELLAKAFANVRREMTDLRNVV
jgi:hypothetical protein